MGSLTTGLQHLEVCAEKSILYYQCSKKAAGRVLSSNTLILRITKKKSLPSEKEQKSFNRHYQSLENHQQRGFHW